MSSIRRIISGLSSSISRARLDVEAEPVTPLTPREPLQPIAPVRRGFADQSDFQAEVDDLDTSLAAHAPHLEGMSAPGEAAGAPAPEQLRVFSGESSFESAFESSRPRYAQLLGSQLPSSLGAPSESAGGVGALSGRRGAGGVQGMDDLLSAETAAWELQNLDTSTASVVEPEDLLFMLDPPGSAAASAPVVELGLEDVFEVDGHGAPALDSPELLDPAVRPAGPDEFLADTDDLGSLVPEEPSTGDAALTGVEADLQAQPSVIVDLGAAAPGEPVAKPPSDTFEG
ncbi:hypothetical protein [Myxococcus sp. RHSTA-1-4]|uniref:hypothetical protein n=1 Tax=Myxococcus sp. RHSTA-1-4 TaxID=2874601 RepID=UPI001CBB82C4|nr:hypothetical protein [Myxococcus sp. RHSTA-1-4]MBZ4414871.1 hypothetical protein [Myxococcus sp. RHSTA-1-4]